MNNSYYQILKPDLFDIDCVTAAGATAEQVETDR
jgi:hypothetical protein